MTRARHFGPGRRGYDKHAAACAGLTSPRTRLRAIGRSGARQRVSTVLHMLPERGLAVAVLANVEDVRLEDLTPKISEVLLK